MSEGHAGISGPKGMLVSGGTQQEQSSQCDRNDQIGVTFKGISGGHTEGTGEWGKLE